MTLLQIALLGSHPDSVSWGGLAYNLFWVTSGNILAGAGIMGTGYWYITYRAARRRRPRLPAERDSAVHAASTPTQLVLWQSQRNGILTGIKAPLSTMSWPDPLPMGLKREHLLIRHSLNQLFKPQPHFRARKVTATTMSRKDPLK